MLKTVFFVIWLLLTGGLIGFGDISYASVDIFDSNRGKEVSASDKPKKTAETKPLSRGKHLGLMLVGVSEIGLTTLYFKDKKNKSVKIQFEQEKDTALPGHPDLIIEKIENRVVYVQDVNNKYCRENVKKGIHCQPDKGVIEMRLVRKHVPVTAPARKKNKPSKGLGTNKKKEPGITRIDPEDVPEGKRLVKTPFGDRLVPK